MSSFNLESGKLYAHFMYICVLGTLSSSYICLEEWTNVLM
jgi:hypothetical protein